MPFKCAIFSYFRALFGPKKCAEGAQTIPTPTITIKQPRYHSQCSSYGPKCPNEPKMSQKVPKTAKHCIFWSVWLQHVFGLFSASRRFQNKFDPSKSFSTLQGFDVLVSIFHENQVPKSYHCFYVKKWFASHRAAQNVYTFASPGLKASGALRPYSFLSHYLQHFIW